MQTITQRFYPPIEVDSTEKDIVQIWCNGKEDSNVVQIERSNLQPLIDILKEQQALYLSEQFENF